MLYKERKYPCNEESIEYTTYDNAVSFSCDRSDLGSIVFVSIASYVNDQQLNNYFFEFGGWFISEVKPFLNGFQGMDTVTFKPKRK